MVQHSVLLSEFRSNPPAPAFAIKECERKLQLQLPTAYKQFLQHSNGGEGAIGPSSYLQLWRVEDIPELNQSYSVGEFAPGLLLFGSDGGQEAYAFDFRLAQSAVVSIPFLLELNLAAQIAESFDDFLLWLYKRPG